ncbi:MAG TPA: hypothetical protein DD723_00440 [Candidatus Omnitrophica bacterium]|nr:MAG: hypothetical protein A2Z81_03040 [Omnitrophica WOR_2 bacterium GWA2_45_18]HBR13999.1 hypothetical protein [Candidatus Omnitrophota bacterium]
MSFFFRVLFLLFINGLVFILLAEGFLALWGIPKPSKPHSAPLQFSMVASENILYVNVPATRITFQYDGNPRGYFRDGNQVWHTTNRQGFRSTTSFQVEKPPDTVRIIFIGDSFTFGEGVYDEDVYPQQFRRFALEQGLFPNKTVEIINLGVGGYNTQQEWGLLNEYARYLQPDMVVIGYTINDVEPYLFYRSGQGFLRSSRRVEEFDRLGSLDTAPSWIRGFRLSRLFWILWQGHKISRQTIGYYQDLYASGSPSWKMTMEAVSALAHYQKESGIPVYVMIFPLMYRLDDPAHPLLRIHAQLHQLMEGVDLPYFDLWPRLKRYKDTDLWVHPTDQHPNEIVHEIAARALVEFISANSSHAKVFNRD